MKSISVICKKATKKNVPRARDTSASQALSSSPALPSPALPLLFPDLVIAVFVFDIAVVAVVVLVAEFVGGWDIGSLG